MILLKIISNIYKPWRYINYLNRTIFRKVLPDKLVICCRFREEFGRELNLNSPKTFNEKLQWLKLYDRRPEYCNLVDKYEAKKVVSRKIGSKHIIPTYKVWNSQDDINIDNLPNSFVLKTTHDSHSIIICKEKENFDLVKAKKELGLSLQNNYFYGGREWPYKNVKPRIIAEKYMANNKKGLLDYKIHCFNGNPRFVLVCVDRYEESGFKEIFFDLSWNKIPVYRSNCVENTYEVDKPTNLDEMIKMAKVLSEGIPFVRVDFYQVEGVTYFGEMTFFPASGYKRFIPEEYDECFGNLLDLSVMTK